jgi:hypothetical protein
LISSEFGLIEGFGDGRFWGRGEDWALLGWIEGELEGADRGATVAREVGRIGVGEVDF